MFRQMLVESLRREFPDVQILEASEGREALRLVDEVHPSLVLMDIKLRGENGLDLTKKIKNHHPETPVVILTSNDLPEYREAAQKAGATQFVAKGSASFQDIVGVGPCDTLNWGWWKSYEPKGWQSPPCPLREYRCQAVSMLTEEAMMP